MHTEIPVNRTPGTIATICVGLALIQLGIVGAGASSQAAYTFGEEPMFESRQSSLPSNPMVRSWGRTAGSANQPQREALYNNQRYSRGAAKHRSDSGCKRLWQQERRIETEPSGRRIIAPRAPGSTDNCPGRGQRCRCRPRVWAIELRCANPATTTSARKARPIQAARELSVNNRATGANVHDGRIKRKMVCHL
jgi:hypothetical protein